MTNRYSVLGIRRVSANDQFVDAELLDRVCPLGGLQLFGLEELTAVKLRMQRQGLDVALNHLSQAESAFERRQWESANAQIGSCLEALFKRVAQLRLQSSRTGSEARWQLESRGILRKAEAGLVKPFFKVAHEAGSHPGTSNED